MKVIVYNSLIEHYQTVENTNVDISSNRENDFEMFEEWCLDNLVNIGFYELEVGYEDGEVIEDSFMVQIDDDEPDWKDNFDIVVSKIDNFMKIEAGN